MLNKKKAAKKFVSAVVTAAMLFSLFVPFASAEMEDVPRHRSNGVFTPHTQEAIDANNTIYPSGEELAPSKPYWATSGGAIEGGAVLPDAPADPTGEEGEATFSVIGGEPLPLLDESEIVHPLAEAEAAALEAQAAEQAEENGEESKNDEPAVGAASLTTTDYNNLIAPTAMNITEEPTYAMIDDFSEYVSPYSGVMDLNFTDFSLPAVGELGNWGLGRLYQSNQALFADRSVLGGNDALSYFAPYLQNRYELGSGWSFALPSLEVRGNPYGEPELYYHTGKGNVYRVNFYGDTFSNLENYYAQDMVFDEDSQNYSNGQKSSYYRVRFADGMTQYFGIDGRLLGIKDRLGNDIKFNHELRPVGNIVPNGTFTHSESVGVWVASSAKTYYGSNGMRFSSTTTATSTATSAYIPIERSSTGFLLSASRYLQSEVNLTYPAYTGSPSVTVQIYDESKNLLGSQTQSLITNSENIQFDQWVKVTREFDVTDSARYVRVVLKNTSAKGEMAFDDICIDQLRPMISEITSYSGYSANVEYGNYVYDHSIDDPNITVTLGDRTFTYERAHDSVDVERRILIGDSYYAYTDETRFWRLSKFYESDLCKQAFGYESTDESSPERFSFFHTSSSSSDPACTRPLLKTVQINNTKITYNYSKKNRELGGDGYYQLYIPTSRYENYKTSSGWTSTNANARSFSNIWGDGSFTSTFTTTKPGGNFKEEYNFSRNSLNWKKLTDMTSSESVTEEYEYDTYYKNLPSEIESTASKTGFADVVTYRCFTYNDWGGLETETLPMTAAEKNNAATKEKLTTTYEYQNISANGTTAHILNQKTWYPDFGKPSVSESVTLDSFGRTIAQTDAKGDVTEYDFDGDNYAGNPTYIMQDDINRMYGLLPYSSRTQVDWYYAYPNTIYQYEGNDEDALRTVFASTDYDSAYGVMTGKYSFPDGTWDSEIRTEYRHDDLGRLTEVIYPTSKGENGDLNLRVAYEYTESMNVAAYANRSLFQVIRRLYDGDTQKAYAESYYDDYGNLLFKSVLNGSSYITEKYEFDAAGRLVKHTDFNGKETNFAYDAFDRLISSTDEAGNVNYTVYGTKTLETYFDGVTDSEQNHYLQTFDIRGNTIEKQIFPYGRNEAPLTQTFEYDLSGNVKLFKDAKGNETRYEHNAIGQLEKIKYPDTDEKEFQTITYARNGGIGFWKQMGTDGRNMQTSVYDNKNRLAFRFHAGKSSPVTESYAYNASGQMTSKTDRNGFSTSYRYDDFGNLAYSENANDSIDYFYSPFGNIAKYEYTDRDDLSFGNDDLGRVNSRTEGNFTTGYTFNNLGSLTTQTDPFNLQTSYNYNNLNQLDDLTTSNKTFDYQYYDDGMVKKLVYPNGAETNYIYDNANRLMSMITTKSGSAIASFGYTYDANSNVETATENGVTTTYGYDAQNRLTSEEKSGVTTSWEYDSFGNRTTENTEYTGVNRLAADGENEYSYDANGNMLTKGEAGFAYDKRNKMTSATVDETTTNYIYNAEGLRTDKDEIHYHLNENGKVIAESENGAVTNEYIWTDRPLAVKQGANWYYYIYNGHGDVVAMLDESGTPQKTYIYDAWGNTTAETGTLENSFKYAGEYEDAETGFYYLRNRYYDPQTGRFTQEDPIRSGNNWYIYANNNPIMFVDPMGLADEPRYVNGTDVNFRKNAGTNSTIIDVLPKGTQVSWTGQKTDVINEHQWAQVKWNGITGWIAADYLGVAPVGSTVAPAPEIQMSSMSYRTSLAEGFSDYDYSAMILSTTPTGGIANAAKIVAAALPNTINHVMQNKHAWAKVAENTWNSVSPIIQSTIEKGTSYIDSAGNRIYEMIYNEETIAVTTRVVDGITRLVNAWVKTK